MLDRRELKEMAELDGKGYFVSLYLNVDPLFNKAGDYMVHFKNMIKHTSDNLDREIYRKVKDSMSKIENYVLTSKRLFKKGLAVFAGEDDLFWKVYHLNVPVKNELIIDRFPYTKPLIDLLDNYQRYCILIVDKESARIFVVHLGEIVEYGEVHTEGVPGKHKKGGWFALSQDHYERHIDYHVGIHLKEVIEKLASFMNGEYIGRLIIGGSPEAVSMIKDRLPKELLNKVIGTVRIEMFAKPDEVLRKVEPVIKEFERKKEEEDVKKLIEVSLKGGPAVLGLDDVLKAIQDKRVMKLIISKDFENGGYHCTGCGYLTAQKIEKCPYCSGRIEFIEHIIGLAGEKAIEQGSLVEVLSEPSEELKKYGSIGAFLRY
ncbi:MAG: Vms1/Ankzf1 family peptidyl-tRNA hydrolase [Thermodesulfovibrionales bacterium]|nr:Vms1/Ankzf1 family peptidyl-tRNA hydrolase [Thermodesulfovibrionales bacterium]